ncbi:hypothetical protein CIB48_g5230 [Xylaria polymorpha]|nr:hypothetical protein CIB48_g5230 [Xylaria polymorpha]
MITSHPILPVAKRNTETEPSPTNILPQPIGLVSAHTTHNARSPIARVHWGRKLAQVEHEAKKGKSNEKVCRVYRPKLLLLI